MVQSKIQQKNVSWVKKIKRRILVNVKSARVFLDVKTETSYKFRDIY